MFDEALFNGILFDEKRKDLTVYETDLGSGLETLTGWFGWEKRTPPTAEWTKRTPPTTNWEKRTPPTAEWTKERL